MSTYRSVFPKSNTLLIVIHAENPIQVIYNARIAKEGGADGIFLINHQIPAQLLLNCFAEVKQSFPDLWVGLNCLNLHHSETLAVLPHGANGIWIDNAGISEEEPNPVRIAQDVAKARNVYKHRGLYFGGVAFKYQGPTRDPARAAKLAIPFVDIVTTSGNGTGIAASIKKIRLMKEAIGTHPLAIASGITPENVTEYMEFADCFLVATGVSYSHTKLNPSLVQKLAQIISS